MFTIGKKRASQVPKAWVLAHSTVFPEKNILSYYLFIPLDYYPPTPHTKAPACTSHQNQLVLGPRVTRLWWLFEILFHHRARSSEFIFESLNQQKSKRTTNSYFRHGMFFSPKKHPDEALNKNSGKKKHPVKGKH